MKEILASVSEYIEPFVWAFDKPDDKDIIYSSIYMKFLK